GPVWRIPHPAWPMHDVRPADVDGSPVFGCFGHLNASKRIPQLVEAFAAVRQRHPAARLLLVGPASPKFDASRFAGEGIERIDYVPEDRLWSLMARCDACGLLRAPTMGETGSAAAHDLAVRLDELGLARNGRPEPSPRPRDSPLTLLPVWVWLVGAVVMSFALRWWLAGRIAAPWIMVDELIYSELAKSF